MEKGDYITIATSILGNDWDENSTVAHEQYVISQFQGTAFDSDYQCYKVQWSEQESLGNVKLANTVHRIMVAKITNEDEAFVLQELQKRELPVPRILAIVRLNNGKIMVFEQMLSGTELYFSVEHSAWIEAAITLSHIHSSFWNIEDTAPEVANKVQVKDAILEKIHRAQVNVSHRSLWRKYMNQARERFATAPKTLIHGDTFPTNILVDRRISNFVDWADSSVFAYMMDIGRLTAIIDTKTMKPMCPCPDKVIHAYYESMKALLRMDYPEYIRDVHMAQFIELSAIYMPSQYHRINNAYNQVIEKELNKITLSECG